MLKVKPPTDVKRAIINELYKPARKTFARRRTIIKGLDDLWQIDLIDMQDYAKFNRGNKYILVVIDCFSKYVFAKPLKTKTAEDVSIAMRTILKEGRVPKNIQSDEGKEFFNKIYDKLMKEYEINHYHTYSVKKAAIVERVIRTLKEKIYKLFNLNGSYDWIDYLENVIKEYNNTKHRTTGKKPFEITKQNEGNILKSVYNYPKISGPNKYKVGDVVRISKYKHLFEKSYTPRWTTELFRIKKVNVTNPVTYILEDMQGELIKGGFYEKELQKTENSDIYLIEKVVRKKGNKLYVKWLGLDKKFNSWINKSDIR